MALTGFGCGCPPRGDRSGATTVFPQAERTTIDAKGPTAPEWHHRGLERPAVANLGRPETPVRFFEGALERVVRYPDDAYFGISDRCFSLNAGKLWLAALRRSDRSF